MCCSYYSAIAVVQGLAQFVACIQVGVVALEAAVYRLEQVAKVYIPALVHNFAALAA